MSTLQKNECVETIKIKGKIKEKMKITITQLKTIVSKVVPKEKFGELLSYVTHAEPKLWGEDKPKNFIELTLYIILYKWLSGKGNTVVAQSVSQWLKTSHQSIDHNSKKLALVLSIWGRSQIKLFSPEERRTLLQRVTFKKPVEGVTLWMDSTDFRTTGLRSVSYLFFFILSITFHIDWISGIQKRSMVEFQRKLTWSSLYGDQ